MPAGDPFPIRGSASQNTTHTHGKGDTQPPPPAQPTQHNRQRAAFIGSSPAKQQDHSPTSVKEQRQTILRGRGRRQQPKIFKPPLEPSTWFASNYTGARADSGIIRWCGALKIPEKQQAQTTCSNNSPAFLRNSAAVLTAMLSHMVTWNTGENCAKVCGQPTYAPAIHYYRHVPVTTGSHAREVSKAARSTHEPMGQTHLRHFSNSYRRRRSHIQTPAHPRLADARPCSEFLLFHSHRDRAQFKASRTLLARLDLSPQQYTFQRYNANSIVYIRLSVDKRFSAFRHNVLR